jgi:RNA-binding protein
MPTESCGALSPEVAIPQLCLGWLDAGSVILSDLISPYLRRSERMSDLTSKQRAHLRKLAHRLKPIVHVGHEGVTDALVQSVTDALNTRELIKVKVLDAAPDNARKTGDKIVDGIWDAHVAQTIGKTIVIYRPDPEEPEIKLPKPGPGATAAGANS